MKVAINILRTIIIILLVLLVLANGWLMFSQAVLGDNPPSIFGYSQLIVTSGSMQPTFKIGDVVIVKAKSNDNFVVGDVVTFRLENSTELVTHRIVGTHSDGFITRGDANNAEDKTLLTADRIIGKVQMSVPGIGNFLMFLKTPLGMLVLIIGGFLLIELPVIFSGKSRKPKGKYTDEVDN